MTSEAAPRALFVTGTDTNVGKTHVTCLIARQTLVRGSRVAAYKPVCSGATQLPSTVESQTVHQWDDLERLKAAVKGEWSDDVICPQRFIAPVAPNIAARMEGKTVDFQRMVTGAGQFPGVDLLLIEGAGGWLSPLTDFQTVADLAQALGHPVLIVARSGLGTINHTLLTVQSVRGRGLIVAGIVLNDVIATEDDRSRQTNGDEIEARCGAPVFGTTSYGIDSELRRLGAPVTINWETLASR